MFDVMSQAQNAIEAYNQALKISSANIANMNVPGYKKLTISFQSILERVVSQGSAFDNESGGTNPRQLGSSVAISGINVDFSIAETTAGSPLDLAINGAGLFIVSPDGGQSYYYTRNGNFEIDSSGNLTSNGLQVYGFNPSGTVAPITNLPSGSKSYYRWKENGSLQITNNPTDPSPVYTDTGYSIAMTYFSNPGGLAQASGTSFAETLASGPPATASGPGGVIGSIKPGYLEQSNVFYLSETISAQEIQRAMSGNLSVVKMASDLISNFIQKLG